MEVPLFADAIAELKSLKAVVIRLSDPRGEGGIAIKVVRWLCKNKPFLIPRLFGMVEPYVERKHQCKARE